MKPLMAILVSGAVVACVFAPIGYLLVAHVSLPPWPVVAGLVLLGILPTLSLAERVGRWMFGSSPPVA